MKWLSPKAGWFFPILISLIGLAVLAWEFSVFRPDSLISAQGVSTLSPGGAYTATVTHLRTRRASRDSADQLTVTRNRDGAVLHSVFLPIVSIGGVANSRRTAPASIWSNDGDSVSFNFLSADSKETDYTVVFANLKRKDAQTSAVTQDSKAPIAASPSAGAP